MDEFDVCQSLFVCFFFNRKHFSKSLVNIGQNNPGSNNNSNSSTPQTTSSTPSSATATPLQSTGIPATANIPGVMAGNLDFNNILRSLNSMAQGITGQLIPGATLINPNSTATVSSSTTSSTQNSNTSTSSSSTTTNNDENDTITEQMLQGLARIDELFFFELLIDFIK